MLQIYCMWFLWSELVGGLLANVSHPRSPPEPPSAWTESLDCFDVLYIFILAKVRKTCKLNQGWNYETIFSNERE